MNKNYDLAVIGSGPAGQKAAIQAAKLGKQAVVIEKGGMVGGAAINTGTIPSKAIREAVMYLSGASKRGFFGGTHRVKRDITIEDLAVVTGQVIQIEALGAESIVTANLPNVDKPLTARVAGDAGPAVGDRCAFALDPAAAHVFGPDGDTLS